MGKNKKKRNKVYKGIDAAMDRPVITRIQAENRSPVKQWWFDNKARLKPILIAASVIIFIIAMIVEIIRLTQG